MSTEACVHEQNASTFAFSAEQRTNTARENSKKIEKDREKEVYGMASKLEKHLRGGRGLQKRKSIER